MVDWSATLNTVISALAGGGIAITGKALADRRADRRAYETDRRASLREVSQAQKEALGKMLDLLSDISDELGMEYSRRIEAGEHRRFNDKPIDATIQEMRWIGAKLKRYSESKEIEPDELIEFLGKSSTQMVAVTQIMEERTKFIRKIGPFIAELTHNMVRADSLPVTEACDAYLDVLAKFTRFLSSDDAMELLKEKREVQNRLEAAIGKTLGRIPF